MEGSFQHDSHPRERSLPPALPRSVSLNAIDSRRQPGLFTSFYNNLNTILEPGRSSRRASFLEVSQNSCGNPIFDSLVDETNNEDMHDIEEYDESGPAGRSPRDSFIPPVPRVPSIYGRQNALRGRGRGSRRPAQTRPPVSYDRQSDGNMIPLPDPLHSNPTVAGSGLTASASFNNLSQPNRYASGSHFPAPSRPSPRVSSYSSTIQPRDSMFIRPPMPLHEVEQVMRPVTYLPQQTADSAFSSATSNLPTNGETQDDDAKIPSPKHQKSLFGLRKSSAPSSALSQPSDSQNFLQPKPAGFQLRKTPSRVMNLDQVAQGAAPVTGDSLLAANTPINGPETAPLHVQPTARRQRSRFQLRKTPTRMASPVASNLHGDHVDMEYSNSEAKSTVMTNFKASISSTDESLSNKPGNTSDEPLRIGTKQSRSIFGLRKTPTGIIHPSMVPSTKAQNQGNGSLKASPRQYRSTMNLQPTSPTRIPTPVGEAKGRYFSTPVFPSQKKENVHPRTHRLLGPISPSRTQGPPPKAIPKARTMGMLSNLTSTFTRSSTNLTNPSSSSVVSLARTAEPTTSVSNASATAPQPSFTPNIHHIHEAQHSTWWCGRFTSLNDRFHGEMLEETMKDPETFKNFQDNSTFAAPKATDIDPKKLEEQKMYEPATAGIQHMRNDEDRRALRVFAHLKSLCVTDEARKSLFDFQQTYARMNSNEKWLPDGGTMEDKTPGWVSRVTNVIGRRSEKSGNQTAMGRRTRLSAGVFGNKRNRAITEAGGNLN